MSMMVCERLRSCNRNNVTSRLLTVRRYTHNNNNDVMALSGLPMSLEANYPFSDVRYIKEWMVSNTLRCVLPPPHLQFCPHQASLPTPDV